jgi:hypothetical protein
VRRGGRHPETSGGTKSGESLSILLHQLDTTLSLYCFTLNLSLLTSYPRTDRLERKPLLPIHPKGYHPQPTHSSQ